MRRVLVIENQQLLGAGIENLLRREVDLNVLGITPKDEKTLLDTMHRYRPDVVVLDEASTDATRLSALLQDSPELLLVVVSADDHLVRLYESRNVTIVEAAELADLIRR